MIVERKIEEGRGENDRAWAGRCSSGISDVLKDLNGNLEAGCAILLRVRTQNLKVRSYGGLMSELPKRDRFSQ